MGTEGEAPRAAAGAPPAPRPRLKLAPASPGWPGEIGPLYELDLPHSPGGWRRALQLDQRHADADGLVSNAVLLSFLDQVLVRLLDAAVRSDQHPLLLQLSTQHIGTTRPQRWLYGEALVLKQSRHLLFATAELFDDQQPLLVAQASWRLATRG